MKTERRELSFDGKGINGPNEYRSRIATFHSNADAIKYGSMLAAAPDMYKALRGAKSQLIELRDSGYLQGAAAIVKALIQHKIDAIDSAMAEAEGADNANG